MNLEGINILDAILGGIVIISALVGIARGLVREILSLAAWVIALWVAYKFSEQVSAQFVSQFIVDDRISYLASFGLLFILSLFAIGLLNLLIASLFNATGLTGFDRLLGMLFGIARGVIIGALVVFFASLYPGIDKEPWWQQSKLVPGFSNLANWGIAKLPLNIRARVQEAIDSNNVGVLETLETPSHPQVTEKAETIELTSLQETAANRSATRPEIDSVQRRQQAIQTTALSADNPIILESMSDDMTTDQNTDHIAPDSDLPPEIENNDYPLQLESIQ
ncbi:CvpA family protein [Suttonella ornithocola]|uniref:Pur regulon 18 kDa protein n=1 Tax=Suttonella ornithocola TaxID=279832 RepID=A0A380N0F8_9GAMM|nr:CvpA family protein [Suttonella ornithocola]SUO97603.1 Pur regulon 18 kDa protein [Suttonella ornithocola]